MGHNPQEDELIDGVDETNRMLKAALFMVKALCAALGEGEAIAVLKAIIKAYDAGGGVLPEVDE